MLFEMFENVQIPELADGLKGNRFNRLRYFYLFLIIT
jgi:hypothetical protein